MCIQVHDNEKLSVFHHNTKTLSECDVVWNGSPGMLSDCA